MPEYSPDSTSNKIGTQTKFEVRCPTWKEIDPEIKKTLATGLTEGGDKRTMRVFIQHFSQIIEAVLAEKSETDSGSYPAILEKIGMLQHQDLIRAMVGKIISEEHQTVEIIPFYEATKMQEICERFGLEISFLSKGSNLINGAKDCEPNRGFTDRIFFDVNDGQYDHKGPNSTATTEVVRDPKIRKEDGIKYLVTHEKSDLDSVCSVVLYLMKLNGELKGDEPILDKFKTYVEAYDLGRWQELNFKNAGLNYVVDAFGNGNFSDLKVQQVMYEVIDRIIKQDLDPTNLKGADFKDMKIKYGKSATNLNIGKIIDEYEKKRMENLKDFYERAEFYEFPDGTKMAYIERSLLSKFEIYQLGYPVVFDSVCFASTQKWADEHRELIERARDLLDEQEQKTRRQIANFLEAFSTKTYLREDAPRPGFKNSNPWFGGENWSQLVQPAMQKFLEKR